MLFSYSGMFVKQTNRQNCYSQDMLALRHSVKVLLNIYHLWFILPAMLYYVIVFNILLANSTCTHRLCFVQQFSSVILQV